MSPLWLTLALAALPAAAAQPNGAALYATNCASCHGVHAQGSADAPAIAGLAQALIHFELDTGRMPAPIAYDNDISHAPKFTQLQIDAIGSYIASFDPHADRSMPQLMPGNAKRGRLLFAENCAACHGATGAGADVGSDDVAPSLMGAATFVVAEAIRGGPGVMPRFGPGALSAQDVSDIAYYVNALQTHTGTFHRLAAGGAALGNLGPVAEGIIGWLFGIGSLVLFVRFIGTTS